MKTSVGRTSWNSLGLLLPSAVSLDFDPIAASVATRGARLSTSEREHQRAGQRRDTLFALWRGLATHPIRKTTERDCHSTSTDWLPLMPVVDSSIP
jgi:hypothetical protein